MRRIVRGNKGFALVLTMVVSALMVAVVVELIHQVYVDVSLSRGFRDGQQASMYAESGITGGIQLLQMSLSGQDFSSLSDRWAKPFLLDDETGDLEISVIEESSKINLNDLILPNGEIDPFTLAALRRLGSRLQIADDSWSALADWIDTDDQPRTNGTESAYYKALKRPYSSRNNKLTSYAELSLVKGFSADVMMKLRPFVTVYAGGQLSQININTASNEILSALDDSIDERMAQRIDEERRLKPFKSIGELSRVPGAEALSLKLTGKIAVKGSLFRVVSQARVKESSRTIEAVVRLGNGNAETLSWQEY